MFDTKKTPTDTIYENIVQDMHTLYNHEIHHHEAHDAARNFIGFMQTLLEIKRDKMYNEQYEYSD